MLSWLSLCVHGAVAEPVATPQPESTPSALSYGLVTSQVRKGETTQLDLIQLFGAPNISTYDSAGVETWVYERNVTQTDAQTHSEVASGAAELGLFFSVGQAGAGAAGRRQKGDAQIATSLRSITVIVKFSENGTVSDFKVRSSQF
jgi:hypothetical protein